MGLGRKVEQPNSSEGKWVPSYIQQSSKAHDELSMLNTQGPGRICGILEDQRDGVKYTRSGTVRNV